MKIKIEVKKKEVELSLDEARELWAELNQIFGQKEVAYIPYPTYPQYPVITYTDTATLDLSGTRSSGVQLSKLGT